MKNARASGEGRDRAGEAEPTRVDRVARGQDARTSAPLESHAEFGVWGGLTTKERRIILHQAPTPSQWRPIVLTG